MARKNYSRYNGNRRRTSRSRNVFAGADDVYLTKESIAVRRIDTSKGRNGRAKTTDRTRYIPKTAANLNKVKKIFGYIRTGRK